MSSTPEVQTIIVRARVKPLSEQPEWAVCCDRIKSQFDDVGELYVKPKCSLQN